MAAAAAAALLGTAPLPAAVSSATFGVSVTVAPDCSVDLGGGGAPPAVACSMTAPYSVKTVAVPASSVQGTALQAGDSPETVVLVTIAY